LLITGGSKPVSPVTKIYSNAEFGTHLSIGSPEMPSLFLLTVDKELRSKRDENFLWGDIVTMKRRLFSDTSERVWGR
jgi:hypothetical protein